MDLREKTPASAQVHPIHHQVGVRLKARRPRSISEAYSECKAALFSPLCVQQDVPRYPEDPRPRILMEARRFIEATPHNKERVRNDVFGVVRAFGTALNKSEQVWINRFVQQSKGLLPVRGTRKAAHNLYMSVTGLSVSQESAKALVMDDAPERYISGQMRVIVGVELLITRIEAKTKLSQNRSGANIDDVAPGLHAQGQTECAADVARTKLGAPGDREHRAS